MRLRNGDTLISDQFNHRVIEVNRKGRIVFTAGVLNKLGFGGGLLNSPYDAKVNGDFTGLTPPFGDEDDQGDGQQGDNGHALGLCGAGVRRPRR